MRRPRPVETLLTVNAVLLAAVLVAGPGQGLAQTAVAQPSQTRSPVRFPNAASQRAEMVKALKALEQKIDANTKALQGTLKVEVTNLDEIKVEVEMPREGSGG